MSVRALARHRPTRRVALILAGVVAWTSLTLQAATDLPATITVRVYQTAATLPSMLEPRVLAEAEAVLRTAHVNVRWRTCTGLRPSAACDQPPGPSELVLVVREDGDHCRNTPAMLGNAIVVHRGGGVLANVYFSCVAWLAKVTGTDVAVLLGRVAAHELGHLMMRTSAHEPRGLMRPNWTPAEVRENRAADWAFTQGDVAAIREAEPAHSENPDCCVDHRPSSGID